MEKEVDEYLVQSNASSLGRPDSISNIIYMTTLNICYVLAMLSNIIFVYLVLLSKKLRNRRNLVITHWCLAHFTTLVCLFVKPRLSYHYHTLKEALFTVAIAQIFVKLSLIIVLITHSIMESAVPINLIALLLHGIAATFMLLDVIGESLYIKLIIVFLLFLVLIIGFIAVIIKHVNESGRPISDENALRLHLATLYIITWIIYFMYFGIKLNYPFLLILEPCFHLTPMFMIIILIFKDDYFKTCLMQSCCCQGRDSDNAVCSAGDLHCDKVDIDSNGP